MTMLALSLAYAGFTGVCLSMQRHRRQVWAQGPSPAANTVLRIAGWLCLGLSLLPCFAVWGAAIAAVAWFGVLSVAGFVLAFLLPYAPRSTAALAVIALLFGVLSAFAEVL
ncbi:DUF3325 domain-containing protein [Pelagibius sp.]|uniref:DUF3325 domain-containing protein n=1 Tax=Pelagibius sp. TaxID=1931238 RepID=UPI003BB160B8